MISRLDPPPRLRSVLVCHEGADLNRIGLARWLGSWSELAGIVVLREVPNRRRKRWRREMSRVGLLRFLDVVAFRLWYRLALAARDHAWEQSELARLTNRFPDHGSIPVLTCASINSREAVAFLLELAPDLVIARCKQLLREEVFTIPAHGTFVFHPGHCPRYRNAHGCFWALVNDDAQHVAMTMLRIDRGVDTGPMYGYYTYPFDARRESHAVIQHRVVLENLDAIAERLRQVCRGEAETVRPDYADSATWGQPWLTSYLAWRWRTRGGPR
jgi:hypothetical protein